MLTLLEAATSNFSSWTLRPPQLPSQDQAVTRVVGNSAASVAGGSATRVLSQARRAIVATVDVMTAARSGLHQRPRNTQHYETA